MNISQLFWEGSFITLVKRSGTQRQESHDYLQGRCEWVFVDMWFSVSVNNISVLQNKQQGFGGSWTRNFCPSRILGLGTAFFFDTIFVSIHIDRYSIYHLIHAFKTVIYEKFVKSSQ